MSRKATRIKAGINFLKVNKRKSNESNEIKKSKILLTQAQKMGGIPKTL